MITRRETLQLAAGAIAAFGSSPLRGARGARLGIGSSSYSQRWRASREGGGQGPFGTPADMLDHCHQLGAGGIQVGLRRVDKAGAEQLRKKAEAYGMYIEGSVRLPKQESEVAAFRETVELARAAGAEVLRTVFLGGRRYETFDSADAFEEFSAQSWKSLTLGEPVVRKAGLKLAIENHKDFRVSELLPMLERISSEAVGVCVDTGNNISMLEPPMETVEAYAPYAYSVHLKDMAVKEYEKGFLLSEVPFGEGFLDLKKVVTTLRKEKPGLNFTLEMITRDPLEIPCLTDKYWASSPKVGAPRLARMLALVRSVEHQGELPRISHLSTEEKLKAEDENVRKCLAYAGQHLGL